MVFGFFALVLVMIYWINRAVALFDQLISDGQSAGVFLELMLLSLPGIVRSTLPFAAFVATLYATNRLAADSELVVAQAGGMSPFRLARGVLAFGLIVAVMMAIVSHILVPLSTAQLSSRQAEIARSATTRLLQEGQFLTPAEDVTIYTREISPDGELRDLFLQDDRDPDERMTYTARDAYLVSTTDSSGERGAQLVMIGGMMQQFSVAQRRLVTTGFEDFSYDIGALMPDTSARGRGVRELSTQELLTPTSALSDETGRSAAQMMAEGHGRIADPILAFAAALMGYAALMLGGFSRFGLWRQITLAVGLVLLVKALEAATGTWAAARISAWPLVYLPAAVALVLALGFLWHAAYPHPFTRRRPA